MNRFFLFFLSLMIALLLGMEFLPAVAVGTTIFIFFQIILKSNQTFVFREWALFLYAVNYLFSPAITYLLPSDQVTYGMRLSSDAYFTLAIPGFLCLAAGMYFFKTTVFKPDFVKINVTSFLNEKVLYRIMFSGILLRFISGSFPGELAFFIYLISLVRFVSSFALFALNPHKNWLWVVLVLIIELYNSFIVGMYHDAVMWIIFFGLFSLYVLKPTMQLKIAGGICLMIIILLIQAIKADYRSLVWGGERSANLQTVVDVSVSKANSAVLFGDNNILGTLNRTNQAWILASTVDRMNRFSDFQGLALVERYFEAALLPRFLAPNKLISGDKEIFNRFSGHEINAGTSMGLGIFADGYIAYGTWGVYIFGFMLGLIFSLTFKLVERWSRISPIYVLLLLALLNYAVRPDCELQTTINHLTKGIVVFGFLVYLSKGTFSLKPFQRSIRMPRFGFGRG